MKNMKLVPYFVSKNVLNLFMIYTYRYLGLFKFYFYIALFLVVCSLFI